MKMGLRYKIIDEFPAYRVGTDGTVWSRWKRGFGTLEIGKTWKKLTAFADVKGYRFVGLSNEHRKIKIKVSVVVLTAFRGPKPHKSMHAAHLNGKSGDDRLVNLKWKTPKANVHDRIKHGTMLYGEDVPAATLRNSQVRDIKKRLADGEADAVIAKDYGVLPGAISHIRKGNTWKTVN